MKAEIAFTEPSKPKDYFPCLFSNKGKDVVILADGRTGDRTFSGMVVYSTTKIKNSVGYYSSNWSYDQFARLPKGTHIVIGLTQDED